MSQKIKICIVSTVASALKAFMEPHIRMLRETYDVTLIANATEEEMAPLLGDHTRFIRVDLQRKISLWKDLHSLLRLYVIFRRERFDVVHSLMPKTGLLSMAASLAAGIRHRVHCYTGQVWASKKGMARAGLKYFDKITALCATALLTDGFSQRDFLIKEKVVPENKIDVLGPGSVCGVDLNRFKPDPEMREQMRSKLGIPKEAIILIFVGRLNRDKGVPDLVRAFVLASKAVPDMRLLLLGADEENMTPMLKASLGLGQSQVHFVGFTDCPEAYMAASDIICLPSYREGFGSSIIEAAAVGLPAVLSDIYGLRDAVIPNESGIFHAVGNIDEMTKAIVKLATDDVLRKSMSEKARLRVNREFEAQTLVAAMRAYYEKMLGV